MSNIDKPAARQPIAYVTINGKRIPAEVDPFWFRLLFGLFERVGGTTGLSTTDVDGGSFAAMQPLIQEAAFADVIQNGGVGSDCPAEVLQTDFNCQQAADIYQG